ncbi:hypothetical protein DFLDMN_003125 [Cupriavidus sp. H19C3]
MPQITFLTNDNKVVDAPANSNLLRVSLREQGGIPFKCGGGLCGTCRCRIESGLEHTDAVKPKERRHLNDDDLANGYRMACQTFVNGDISVSWDKHAPAPRPPSIAVRPPASPARPVPANAAPQPVTGADVDAGDSGDPAPAASALAGVGQDAS